VSSLTPDQRAEVLERHLHERGYVDPEAIDHDVAARERGDGASTALGATIVARAWADPAYKERLLADATSTISELARQTIPITVLENTAQVHHVIVCTLCSCYPSGVLGAPPTWYKSFEYRSRVVREPREVLAEFGLEVPGEVELRVVDSTSEQRFLVLPQRPAGTEGWSEEQLAALVTRNSMVGTGLPLPPASANMPAGRAPS
jgi:nitrile hydratase